MNLPIDTENLAKEDIIARPDVTEKAKAKKEPSNSAKKPKNSAKNSAKNSEKIHHGEVLEPDALEIAASKVMGKTIDEFRTALGAESDKEFTTLLSEVLGGGFAAIRFASGRPWIRFAIAGAALTISIIPPSMSYMAAKKKKAEEEKNASK